MRRRVRARLAAVVVGLLVVFATLACSGSAAAGARGCHKLRLTGLSVRQARAKAALAHCKVTLRGAPVHAPAEQTVARQSVGSGNKTITLWVNPQCEAPPHEPAYASGPTQLVTALYSAGGPPRPGVPCWTALAGTVVVTDAAGAIVASQDVESGELAHIPLAAGDYSVEGVYDTVILNGNPAHSRSQLVAVVAGQTVRQDVTVGIP